MSLPAAWTRGDRAERPGRGGGLEELAAGGRGCSHGGLLSGRQGVQLELADEQLEPLRLQQDLARRRERRRRHLFTVVPLTRTVIRSPSQRHSTRVHSPSGLSTSSLPRVSSSSLKSGSCRDHQSWPPVKIAGVPPSFQRGRLSGPRTTSLVSCTGIAVARRVLAADDDQVADAALGELALDRRHPGAVRPAVAARSRAAGCPSSARTCRRRSACPTCTRRPGDSRGTPSRWRRSRSRRR